jgi:hypothetical protein
MSFLTAEGQKWPLDTPYFNGNNTSQAHIRLRQKIDDILIQM